MARSSYAASRPRTSSPPRRGPCRGYQAQKRSPGGSWRSLLAAVGAASALALGVSTPPFAAALEAGPTYRVRPGDTLGAIAAATGQTVQRLAALNGLADADRILAGQELALDAADAGARLAAPAGSTYQVQPGDTLSRLALRAGTTPAALAKLNGLVDVDRLKVGQRLLLPAGATLAPTEPRAGGTARAPLPRPGERKTLEQRVLAETRRVAGPSVRVGVAARNLTNGTELTIRANERFPAASVMKLPILVELERQVATGKLSWSPGLRARAEAMITLSDNEAANQLRTLVGVDNVNATAATLGLSATRLVNPFSAISSPLGMSQNSSSPADMALLLDLVARDQVVNATASADIRDLLARNTDRSKLARLLPAGTAVAHKSGWYQGVANDVGIITTPGGQRWVIAAFSEGVSDGETGNQTLAMISRLVYDEWAGPGAPGGTAVAAGAAADGRPAGR